MAVMVDLEGTLSDHSDRLAVLQRDTAAEVRNRDAWKTYYKGLPDDEPRPEVVDLVLAWVRSDIRPIVYSTRFINKYNHEEQWLRMHDLWDHVDLVQRQPDQTKIKGPDLVAQWAQRFKATVLVDDRDEVQDACRGLVPGLIVFGPKDLPPPPEAA